MHLYACARMLRHPVGPDSRLGVSCFLLASDHQFHPVLATGAMVTDL